MSEHDRFWGCGRDVEKIVLDGRLGDGINMLGKLLTSLRSMFLEGELDSNMSRDSWAYALTFDVEV